MSTQIYNIFLFRHLDENCSSFLPYIYGCGCFGKRKYSSVFGGALKKILHYLACNFARAERVQCILLKIYIYQPTCCLPPMHTCQIRWESSKTCGIQNMTCTLYVIYLIYNLNYLHNRKVSYCLLTSSQAGSESLLYSYVVSKLLPINIVYL